MRERRPGPRVFYGWPMLVGLSAAETLSWGVLYYCFPVFIQPLERELGFTRTQVTGAFSLALLASGLAAVPIGHWLDARGARGLMTCGSVAGSVLLATFATIRSLPGLYTVWLALGVVMAMVLYEPAFAVVARWFVRHRDRALTVLTVFGGLASLVTVPLATWLVEVRGWRVAALSLAVILGCTLPLHALLLRKDPASLGLGPDGDEPEAVPSPEPLAEAAGLGSVMQEGRFRALTAALSVTSLVTAAAGVHLIPYLTGAGMPAPKAALVLGLTGVMQLPGRLLFGPLRRHFGWPWIAAGAFLSQALALVVLTLAPRGSGIVLFVCLFGVSNGMATLVRASALLELSGREVYGRVGGVVSLFSTLGRAGGPFVASLLYVHLGGYGYAFASLVALLLVPTALVLVPGRQSATGTAAPPGRFSWTT